MPLDNSLAALLAGLPESSGDMLYRFFDTLSLASLVVLLSTSRHASRGALAPLTFPHAASAHFASATHAPLFPSLHTHLSRPAQRPSHRTHLRTLQAVYPPPSAVLAAREREHKAETVRWLERLGDGLSTKGEELGKTAERIKRSLGGTASEEEKLRMGVALVRFSFRARPLAYDDKDTRSTMLSSHWCSSSPPPTKTAFCPSRFDR